MRNLVSCAPDSINMWQILCKAKVLYCSSSPMGSCVLVRRRTKSRFMANGIDDITLVPLSRQNKSRSVIAFVRRSSKMRPKLLRISSKSHEALLREARKKCARCLKKIRRVTILLYKRGYAADCVPAQSHRVDVFQNSDAGRIPARPRCGRCFFTTTAIPDWRVPN